MANELEKWLKNKKNRQMVFFLAGVVMLYFYVRSKGKKNEVATGYQSLSGYSGGKVVDGYGTGNNGNSTPVSQPNAQLGGYLIKYPVECFPGHMKIDLQPTGDGLGFKVTDLVTTVVNTPGWWCSYVINETIILFNKGRLVNFIWHLPGPLSIRKIKHDPAITSFYMTGGGNSGDTIVGIEAFDHNTSWAQTDIIAIKQDA